MITPLELIFLSSSPPRKSFHSSLFFQELAQTSPAFPFQSLSMSLCPFFKKGASKCITLNCWIGRTQKWIQSKEFSMFQPLLSLSTL